MRIQRTLPPAAALVTPADVIGSLCGVATRRHKDALEFSVKQYFGVKHVFLVSSGKAALTIALQALHTLSSRLEVILPAYTCFSVPSAVMKAGLQVSVCDVDPL